MRIHAEKIAGLGLIALLGCTGAGERGTPPTMKMTTAIPAAITTPERVETRLGTLKFFDGMPDEETAEKVYDNLDFMHGVDAFLNAMPGASVEAMRLGFATQGADNNQTILLLEDLMDSHALFQACASCACRCSPG
jgi:hypothetical protein